MLEIKNISKRFGGVIALNGCTFTVPRNKITALIGPNGAGKTTLFDVVSGLIRPDDGQILLDGTQFVSQRPDAIARAGISRTWQQVRLFKYLTMLDHLVLAESNEDAKMFANLASQPRLKKDTYQNIIDRFGIDRPLDTVVTELSYGQRKLLQLAMALHRSHRLLLLDEPVAGVNQIIQEKIEKLLTDLKDKNETVVIIEHDIEFVRRLAHHIVVLDQGRVLAAGDPNVVLQDRRVIEAYLGA